MSDDFLDDFGLNDAPDGAFSFDSPESEHEKAPLSHHALHLDKWSRDFGERLFDENAILRMSLDPLDDDVWARRVAADCFNAYFQAEPQLADNCQNDLQRAFFAELLHDPEFRSQHVGTLLQRLQSEIAAGNLASAFVDFVDECSKAKPADEEVHWSKRHEVEEREIDPTYKAMKAIAKADEKTGEDLAELRDTAGALGIGMGPGGGEMDLDALSKHFKKIRHSNKLRRIIELAGRYRRLAQAKQRQKTLHGRDETVGITIGDDLPLVLSHEFAYLMDDEMEMEFLTKFANKTLMQVDKRGVHKTGQGPVIIALDESGSMDGEPIHHGKALALALAWVAQHQKRWCALIAYEGCGSNRILELPYGKWPQKELIDWLSGFLGMGSSIDIPVREMPRYFEELKAPRGKTDLIMVTDAICHIPKDVEQKFNDWKAREKVKCTTIILEQSYAGQIADISDTVHCMPRMDVEDDAIGDVLSL